MQSAFPVNITLLKKNLKRNKMIKFKAHKIRRFLENFNAFFTGSLVYQLLSDGDNWKIYLCIVLTIHSLLHFFTKQKPN